MPVSSYGSEIAIEELTATEVGLLPRKLVLRGPSLPFMGAEWATEQNVKTTFYTGNREGTQQVLGPREVPSTWQGEWRRTMLGHDPAAYFDEFGANNAIVSPHILREIVDSILIGGAKLRVTWSVRGEVFDGTLVENQYDTDGDPINGNGRQANVQIVRVGRLTKFATPIDRHTDIGWSMTFDWSGRGGDPARVVSISEEADIQNISRDVVANLKAAIAKRDDLFGKTPQFLTLGQLENVAAYPTKLVNEFATNMNDVAQKFQDAANVAEKFAQAPVSMAVAMRNLAARTKKLSNRFTDTCGRIPTELFLSTTYSWVEALKAKNQNAQFQDAAEAAAISAYVLQKQTQTARFDSSNSGQVTVRDGRGGNKNIIGVHVCKEGETPANVSLKYYQNMDHGTDILKANRLPWYLAKFQKGQIIMIPALTAQTG